MINSLSARLAAVLRWRTPVLITAAAIVVLLISLLVVVRAYCQREVVRAEGEFSVVVERGDSRAVAEVWDRSKMRGTPILWETVAIGRIRSTVNVIEGDPAECRQAIMIQYPRGWDWSTTTKSALVVGETGRHVVLVRERHPELFPPDGDDSQPKMWLESDLSRSDARSVDIVWNVPTMVSSPNVRVALAVFCRDNLTSFEWLKRTSS